MKPAHPPAGNAHRLQPTAPNALQPLSYTKTNASPPAPHEPLPSPSPKSASPALAPVMNVQVTSTARHAPMACTFMSVRSQIMASACRHVPMGIIRRKQTVCVLVVKHSAWHARMVTRAYCATTVKSCTKGSAMLSVHKECTTPKGCASHARNPVTTVRTWWPAQAVKTTHSYSSAVHNVLRARSAPSATSSSTTSPNATASARQNSTTWNPTVRVAPKAVLRINSRV